MFSLNWFIAISLLFLLNQSSSFVAADLVRRTCMKTSYVDLCISSLGVDHRSATSDVKGLAKIILKQTLANAKDILYHKVEFFINQTTDPAVKECLATCAGLYRLVTHSTIPAAMSHLALKEYKIAVGNAMDAAQELEACEESFERKSLKSPLTSWNSEVRDFTEISADILSILK